MIPLYGYYEIELIANESIAFNDNLPPVTITFTGASENALGKTVEESAFWDGTIGESQTKFVFTFSPKYSGEWQWQVNSSISFSSPTQGTITVLNARPEAPTAQNITLDPNNSHGFINEDGTPFYWIGDTAWVFSTGEFSCPGGTCSTGTFDTYARNRALQKFNVVQGNLMAFDGTDVTPNNEGGWPFGTTWDMNQPNTAYLDNVKTRIQYLNNLGIVAAVSPGWASDVNCSSAHPFTSEGIKNYVHAAAQRFKDLSVIWIVASNMHSGDTPPSGCGATTWQNVRDWIHDKDSSHLFTFHPAGTGGQNPTYTTLDFGFSWPDFTYMQLQPCENISSAIIATARTSPYPVVDGEFNYETTDACWTQKCLPPDCLDCNSYLQNYPNCNSSGGCECDPHCGQHHHVKVDKVLHGAWQLATRGAFSVYGNTATYTVYPDKTVDEGGTCLNRDINSVGAGYMTHLLDFFLYDGDDSDSQPDVGWADPNFQFAFLESADHKMVIGRSSDPATTPPDKYLFYSENAGTYPQIIGDSGPFVAFPYNTTTGTWDASFNIPAINGTISAVNPDRAILAYRRSFVVACDPPFVSIPDFGGTATANCTVDSVLGFTGSVTLSCQDFPAPTGNCSFTPSTVDVGHSTTLSVTVPANALTIGPHPFFIKGTGENQTKLFDYSVYITGAACDTLTDQTDWEIKEGAWTNPQPGILQGASSKIGRALAKTQFAPPGTYYTIETTLSFATTGKYIAVLGWYESDDTYVQLEVNRAKDVMRLKRFLNGRIIAKKKRDVALTTGIFYRAEFGFYPPKPGDESGYFRARLFDPASPSMPIAEFEQNIGSSQLPYGRAGLKVKNITGQFDHFLVCYGCVAGEASVSDWSGDEGASGMTTATFTIALQAESCIDRTVGYYTEAGTATGGTTCVSSTDYVEVPQSPVAEATITAGEHSENVTVNICGDVNAEENESFNLNLRSSQNVYTTAQATGTILNDDAPALPSLSIADSTLNEADLTMRFHVLLSYAISSDVTVGYRTTEGTASAGSDFTAASGQLDIPAGSRSGIIVVALANDSLAESDETLGVTLSSAIGAAISDDQATGTIIDDDRIRSGLPIVTVSDAAVTEGASGGTISAVFTLRTTGGTGYHVDYSTLSGTATSGQDFVQKSGTVYFSGKTATVSVVVNGDAGFEGTEVFYLNLSNSNASLVRSGGMGVISDDDGIQITVGDVSHAEGNSGSSNMNFQISLAQINNSANVTVTYATQSGTATAGADYTSTSGTATIASGQLSTTVSVPVIGDLAAEGDEMLFLNLTNPSNAIIGDAQASGAILDDEPRQMSISDATISEDTGGTNTVEFPVTISTSSINPVTVSYTTANGTALAGSDYVAASGTLTIPPGSTTTTLTITVNSDSVLEPDEFFSVYISGATNATIIDSQAQATIEDDDMIDDDELDDM